MAQPKRSTFVTSSSGEVQPALPVFKRVVLTRPAERQQQLAKQLKQAGFDVLQLPALTISPIGPAEHVPASTADVTNWPSERFDVLVFVSRAAWQYYQQFYLQRGDGSQGQKLVEPTRTPAKQTAPILACVGLGTARQIAADLQLSVKDIVHPTGDLSSDSEGLWALLRPRLKPGAKVLIVRGQTGRDWLADTLKDSGMSVCCLSVYQRETAHWPTEKLQILKNWATPQNPSGPVSAELHNTGTWLITSAQSLAAISAQYEALGFTGQAGFQPRAVVVVHKRLVPLVRAWLGHWQPHPNDANPEQCQVPVVVTEPDDEAIYQTLMALPD